MTDERAADQTQYLRIVAFDSEVRHEGVVRRGIEGVGSRIVFSVAERPVFAHCRRLPCTRRTANPANAVRLEARNHWSCPSPKNSVIVVWRLAVSSSSGGPTPAK